MYAVDQGLLNGVLAGYTRTTRRLVDGTNEEAITCWNLCSARPYSPIFFFAVEASTGVCYCSQDRYVR